MLKSFLLMALGYLNQNKSMLSLKKILIVLFTICLFAVPVFGQDIKIRNPLEVVTKLKTPESELKDVIVFLERMDSLDDTIYPSKKDREYIKFFTTYDLPVEMRNDAILTLSYICHSMAGVSSTEENAGGFYPLAKMEEDKFIPLSKVTDTIYYIDVRNYNWTNESWEKVALEDGIFVEPVVPHKENSYLRLVSGNAILRASWFIVNSSDSTRQVRRKRSTIIYDTLLYAKNKIPKTGEEFNQIWGVNVKEQRKQGNEAGVPVTKSKVVANNNRFLFSYRSPHGFMHKTYDVIFQEGLRDYIENLPKYRGLPPPIFDASEMFANNQQGLLVFSLTDGADKIVTAGDTAVVKHLTDVLGDAVVRYPHSCYDCHSAGPLVSENTLKEFIRTNSILKVPYKEDQLRIQKNFLSDKFEDSIEDGQLIFSRSLLRVNGLKPDENAKKYLDMVRWYTQPLDLKQAAFECGVSVEEYKSKVTQEGSPYKNPKVPVRIGKLIVDGEQIPRDIWDSRGFDGQPGLFQQSMILINGLTQIVEEKVLFVTAHNARIVSSTETLKVCEIGEKLPYLGEVVNSGHIWYKVNVGDKFGWISQKHVEVK